MEGKVWGDLRTTKITMCLRGPLGRPRRLLWLMMMVMMMKRTTQLRLHSVDGILRSQIQASRIVHEYEQTHRERIRAAKEALNYVEQIAHLENCSEGNGPTLSLTFDTSAWVNFADPAIRTANYFSMLLAQNNNTLKDIPDITFFNLVLNNVHLKSLIYGAAAAFEEDVLKPGRARFAPYAYRNKDGSFTSFDIAQNYNYINTSGEWWEGPKSRNYSDVKIVTDKVTFDKKVGIIKMRTSVANYSHGYWTKPYYDCGGGNIWMVTFSAPILALDSSGTPVFKGVTTTDLELTHININQCDAEEGEEAGSLDIFRNTHNCHPTTKCVPIKNRGFKRSSYNCECLDGFYFPGEGTDGVKAFRGVDIDNFFDQISDLNTAHSWDGTASEQAPAGLFQCVPCGRGCVTCEDNTPCLYQTSTAIRVLVVVIVILLICGCVALSVITYRHRTDLVMKTASPSFLQIMILGVVLMCLAVLLMYPEPTDLLCSIFVWPFHLGIILLYGSLLLKTWRISVIFTSRRKVKLGDKVLLQRLVFLPLLMSLFLAAWAAINPPHVVTISMLDTKKFFVCSFDKWNYTVFGGEALMLLVGVYLSFTVRKAPAQFNESKYITWAIYNAIVLGVFIIIITKIMASTAGPDILYVLLMLQLHVFDTIALCLIFVPKIWTLHKGLAVESMISDTRSTTGGTRTRSKDTASQSSRLNKSVQVKAEYFDSSISFSSAQERPTIVSFRSSRVFPLKDLSTETTSYG